MNALRIVIVDDHPVMCQGIALLLQGAGMTVCGTAAGVVEAIALLERECPDVVLVDLTLGAGGDGLELLAEIDKKGSSSCQVVYSMREDTASILQSLEAGAVGYVTKSELWETLVAAIRAAACGRRYLSPHARRSMDIPVDEDHLKLSTNFSAREHEVFRFLGEGFAIAEMAARLGVSPRTVESYCSRLLVKLDLRGMRELRRRAIASRPIGRGW